MNKEKIVNIQTGEETWRDYTAEEIAEVNKAQVEAQAKAEAQAQAEAQAASAKASAEAKLEALGLTAEDLKALGL